MLVDKKKLEVCQKLKTMSKEYQKRTKNVVNGWIKELEKILQLNHIPSIITSICVKYIGKIDKENICICGSEMHIMPISQRMEPTPLLCTNYYQHFYIICDLCDYQIRTEYYIKHVFYCNNKSKLHPHGFDKCYPKCLEPHQNGLKIRGRGNCRCKKCKR